MWDDDDNEHDINEYSQQRRRAVLHEVLFCLHVLNIGLVTTRVQLPPYLLRLATRS
jgi:hypothetical protein